MQTATIFDIQKFSLNDGPGIRTVVFLKGCPLRCAWCANPESQDRAPQLQWRERTCIGCGLCLSVAPNMPARSTKGKRHLDVRTVDARTPEADRAIAGCPTRSLTRVGTTMGTDEVLKVCLQDKPFYEDSEGGVTLSGGEALTWPDFCEELLELLRGEGVDTCVETEAHVPGAIVRRIAPLLDHMLIDLKQVNPSRLRSQAGADASRMLRNLSWALANHPDVLPRTPVIPGFNDSAADARAMARWLRKVGGTRVQLLPFHNFGEGKYALLDRTYAFEGTRALGQDDLIAYRNAWLDEGIEAFF